MIRPIAINLPQYHPIPENDEWWGKGFTEWHNVTKSKPLFKGHYQPQLPTDLGFYDLRLPQARKAQAELAKKYGIYGFCYYHYWFSGKKVLELPIEEILKSSEPDFPFMLCWANENWTRRWDGGDETILLKQEYSREDDRMHIKYLIPFFKDPRYIKINGKAVFAIYRSSLIPDINNRIKIWRNECLKEGVELYLTDFENSGNNNNCWIKNGGDGRIEFQPFSFMLNDYLKYKFNKSLSSFPFGLKYRFFYFLKKRRQLNKLKISQSKRIDYVDYVDYVINNYKYPKTYTLFPCIMPSWDNTARRGKDSLIFLNSNPEKFKNWVEYHYSNFDPPSPEENLLFINAWNEWAEGNHLEPCQKWGHRFLQALKEGKNKSKTKNASKGLDNYT